MKVFDNFEKAHKHFKFPGSHRIGALFKNSYIVRIYSNSVSKPDYFNKSKTLFYYTLSINDLVIYLFFLRIWYIKDYH